jgi:hypothetical protein
LRAGIGPDSALGDEVQLLWPNHHRQAYAGT